MRTRQCCRSGFFGRARALRARRPRQHAHATCQRLRAVVVEANELNKWADIDGEEENSGNDPISETYLSFDVMGSVGKVCKASMRRVFTIMFCMPYIFVAVLAIWFRYMRCEQGRCAGAHS